MNITDFDTVLNGFELERGFAYYKSGCLEDVKEKNAGTWQTTVRGSGYRVEAKIKADVITANSCSCPADSLCCKHIIATLYTIRYGLYNAGNPEIKSPLKAEKPKAAPKESFRDLLDKIPPVNLQEFIFDYAAENKMFKSEFLVHFAEKSNVHGRDDYAKMVQRAINSTNSIRYKDIQSSLRPVEVLVAQAKDAFARKEFNVTVEIAFAVIDKLQDLTVIMQGDTRGGIGGYVESGFDLLRKVTNADIPVEIKKYIFKHSLIQASSGKYRGHWNEEYWNDLLIATAYDDDMKKRIPAVTK